MAEFNMPDNYPSDDDGFIPPKVGGTVALRRATFTYEDTSETTLFTVPEGAVVVDFYVQTDTAFDDGTASTADIGFTTDVDGLAADVDVTSAGLQRAGAGATLPVGELNQTPLGTDTDVVVTVTNTAGDATEGSAQFVLLYTREAD